MSNKTLRLTPSVIFEKDIRKTIDKLAKNRKLKSLRFSDEKNDKPIPIIRTGRGKVVKLKDMFN